MTETRAAARMRIVRNGLFIGARTPCFTVRRSYANEFGAKKARNRRFCASWRSSQREPDRPSPAAFANSPVSVLPRRKPIDPSRSSPATATDSTLEKPSITSCTGVEFRCYSHAKSYGACRACATIRRVRLDSRAISSACAQHIARPSTSRSQASRACKCALVAITRASISRVGRDRALRSSHAHAPSRTSDPDRACVQERCRCVRRASAMDAARAARRSGSAGDGTALR